MKDQSTQHGFTLVEVLVSLSIFTFVSTAAVGVLLVMIDANAKSRNIQSAMSNLSFALDSMTRDIRTGFNYHCGTDGSWLNDEELQDCTSGATAFAFDEGGRSLTDPSQGGACASSRRIAFRLSGGVIERSLCGTSTWSPVTSSDVSVDTLEFITTGTTRGDDDTPVVTIYLDGSVVGKADTSADFQIQTSISQQLLDI